MYIGFDTQALTFNFLRSLGYIRKLTFWSPRGKKLHSQFYVQTTYDDLQRHSPLRYQFTPLSSGASEIYFSCTEKFTLGQCRIRTMDLSIYNLTRYYWTNAHHLLNILFSTCNTKDKCYLLSSNTHVILYTTEHCRLYEISHVSMTTTTAF